MEMRTEYRIIGRFRKDEKPHVVDKNIHWDKEMATARLNELKRQSEMEMARKSRTPVGVGVFSVSTAYESEYDLLDLKIQERQVTCWTDSES